MASSVSPFARSSALWPLERPRREVGLEARYPKTANDGVMGGPGRELQPITVLEIDGFCGRREPEPDRAPLDDQHLVVVVAMRGVPVARPVRPGPGREACRAQPIGEGRAHAAKIRA